MRRPSKRRQLSVPIALAVVVGAACAGSPPKPELGPAGVAHRSFGVGVSAIGGSFVGPGWRVDNFTPGGRGRPSLKTGGEYMSSRVIDFDGDGRIGSEETLAEPTFDLRLRSEVDDGDMWVKAHPLLLTEAGKSLDALLAGYVDAVAQSGDYARGAFFGPLVQGPRRYRAEATGVAPLLLGGRPAIGAVVLLFDAAAPAGAPPSLTVKIVLSKYGHLQIAGRARRGGKPPEAMWPVTERGGRWVVERTALLVVGYANRSVAFDQHLPAFETLLSRVAFDRATYALEPPAASAVAPAPPAPGPSATPPSVSAPPAAEPAASPDSEPPPSPGAPPAPVTVPAPAAAGPPPQ